MPEEQIPCPMCRTLVRVPEDLLGERVQCPECGSYFTAPIRQEDGSLSEPRDTDMPTSAEDMDPARQQSARFRARLSASFLLIVGILGAVVFGMLSYTFWQHPAEFEKWLRQGMEEAMEQQNIPQEDRVEFRATIPDRVKILTNWTPVFFGMSVITCLGALSMMSFHFYWLAITGSVLATVNFMLCCCVLGLPIGVWSLATLMQPDVKALFGK